MVSPLMSKTEQVNLLHLLKILVVSSKVFKYLQDIKFNTESSTGSKDWPGNSYMLVILTSRSQKVSYTFCLTVQTPKELQKLIPNSCYKFLYFRSLSMTSCCLSDIIRSNDFPWSINKTKGNGKGIPVTGRGDP
jgi:hypothetical protein